MNNPSPIEPKMMRVGIRVVCDYCGRTKCPQGRSAPMVSSYCNFECKGYREDPAVGDLWPGESEVDFGYEVGSDGTQLVPYKEEDSDNE